MSIKQFPGGIITKNPTAPTTSSAKGIWTLDQATQYAKAGTWPRIPGAPTIGTATAGTGSATVAFTAPSDLGAGTLTYTATSTPGSITGTGASSPLTVSGLSNGTAYTFIVSGATPGGTGPSSASSNSVTPIIGPPYWFSLLYPASNSANAFSVAVDGSGNVYAFGQSDDTGRTAFQLAKYNTSGTLQWQVYLGSASSYVAGRGMVVDSSGNIYVCGYSGYRGTNDFIIAKYDTSGTLQWQKYSDSSTSDVALSMSIDSSNNIYVCGWTNSPGVQSFEVIKYDSAGTILWQKYLYDGVGAIARGVTVDSSGNVYAIGDSQASGNFGIQIAKYDSSGTLQWQRYLQDNTITYSSIGNAIAVDSSGNCYLCGYTSITGNNNFVVAKLNTSGSLQWQRNFGGGNDDYAYGIKVDSSGYVYVAGRGQSAGVNGFQIVKYDNSGNIQWQRRFSSSNEVCYWLDLDTSGNYYVTGYSYTFGNGAFMTCKFPGDGSLTGSYVMLGSTFNYVASSATDSAGTLNFGTTSNTSSTSSLSNGTATLTAAASSLTATTKTL